MSSTSSVFSWKSVSWKSVLAALAAAAVSALGVTMYRQHRHYNHTIRQCTLGLPSAPKFPLVVTSMLTIRRTEAGELTMGVEKATQHIREAVAAAGGHVEAVLRGVAVLRPSKYAPVDVNVDLVLLSSWPSVERFAQFKQDLQGFSQHVAQGTQHNPMSDIILPQILLFEGLKNRLLGKYHDLSIKGLIYTGKMDKGVKAAALARQQATGPQADAEANEEDQAAFHAYLKGVIEQGVVKRGVDMHKPIVMFSWSADPVDAPGCAEHVKHYEGGVFELMSQYKTGPMYSGKPLKNDAFDGDFDSTSALYWLSPYEWIQFIESKFYHGLRPPRPVKDAQVLLSVPVSSLLT